MIPYYQDDAVTLYHGDCLDVLPQLGSMVDHVITDPPFEEEAHTKGRRVKRSGVELQDKWAWTDKRGAVRYERLPFPAISDAERASAAHSIASIVRRWCLVFCQAEAAHKWEIALTTACLVRRRWCVWTKPDGQPQFSGDRPGVGYETIVACHAPGRSQWNGGGRVGVFSHAKLGDGQHPTMKPVALLVELVTLFTDEGETILDPFAGSGTTGVAAKLNGRKAILIERDEKYCAVAAKRLRETEPGRLFDKAPKAKPQSLFAEEASA